ncbi:MAG: sensor histidine kinase [Gammaproteobacteria bacterium]
MPSLRTRLLLAASLVLAAFVLACGLALDRAFEASALRAQEERLQGLAYALLGAVEPTARGGLTLSSQRLPDPRLEAPQSGLEAALVDARGALVWGSPSLGDGLAFPEQAEVGQWRFLREETRFHLSFGLRWLDAFEEPQRYTLLVVEDQAAFARQMRIYRRTLWAWLLAAALGLLWVQGLVLAWGLAPLRRLRGELQRVEAGRQSAIQSAYPRELAPVTAAINAMIRAGYAQLERQRHSLADLAHSLKTPLAVLRGLGHENALPPSQRETLDEQLVRMQHIVDHQLRRAAAAGSRALSEPVALHPLCQKLAAALGKVYAGKAPRIELDFAETLKVRIDQGDLYELLGNLLENAVKYGRGRARIGAALMPGALRLDIDDDGGGFPDHPESLLERGVRADTRVPGQGIGLAAVAELVRAYGGTLQLERAPELGGARVRISLPQ